MASFTGVGDNVELTLPARGEDVLISLSGTYNMIIELQEKVGEGAYKTLRTYDTADATVADYYTTQKFGEVLRLIVITDTSGTAVATLADGSDKVLHEFGGIGISPAPLQVLQSGIKVNGILNQAGGAVKTAASLVDVTTATLTLSAILHAGRVLMLNRAAGVALTLPEAIGSGNKYTVFVETTATGAHSIVSEGAGKFAGGVAIATDIAGVVMLANSAADVGLSMSGTTTGGVKGSFYSVTDVAPDLWMVDGFLISTGTEASPFTT